MNKMASTKKAASKYRGYTFSIAGELNTDRFLNLLGSICGEKFKQEVKIQRVVKKSDANDSRLFVMAQ